MKTNWAVFRSDRAAASQWLRNLLVALVVVAAGTVAVVHQAVAGPAEEAAAAAQKGAEAFKANQFYEAAVAFQRAAQLDGADPTNLRYAGRAWQEVGHLKRALTLLELYLKIEPDPARKVSIEEKIAPLRRATPVQIADALGQALTKFPQARLEAEAAKAYEAVGDEPSLKRAAELWEIARVRAASDSDRQAADAGIGRVSQRLLDGKAKRDKEDEERKLREAAAKQADGKPKVGDPKVGDPKPGDAMGGVSKPAPGSALSTVLLISGGTLAVGGLALAMVGRSAATTANDDYKAGTYKGDRNKYESDRSSSDNLAYAGWGLAAAGTGVIVWGLMSGSPAAPAKKGVWQLWPVFGRDGGQAVLSVQF